MAEGTPREQVVPGSLETGAFGPGFDVTSPITPFSRMSTSSPEVPGHSGLSTLSILSGDSMITATTHSTESEALAEVIETLLKYVEASLGNNNEPSVCLPPPPPPPPRALPEVRRLYSPFLFANHLGTFHDCLRLYLSLIYLSACSLHLARSVSHAMSLTLTLISHSHALSFVV